MGDDPIVRAGPIPRAALYHRVSTVDQNPTLARDELRQAAARWGASVVLDIEETGSGARNDRPGLIRVMDAVQMRTVDLVIVWKLDRFGRSVLDVATNLQVIERSGARFLALSQGIDFRPDGDPMSRLLMTMAAAFSEFERALIVERTKLGLAAARKRGSRLGRPSTKTPDTALVHLMRDQGIPWADIERELGCTQRGARNAWELCTNCLAREVRWTRCLACGKLRCPTCGHHPLDDQRLDDQCAMLTGNGERELKAG